MLLLNELQNIHSISYGSLMGGCSSFGVLHRQSAIVSLVQSHKVIQVSSFGCLQYKRNRTQIAIKYFVPHQNF